MEGKCGFHTKRNCFMISNRNGEIGRDMNIKEYLGPILFEKKPNKRFEVTPYTEAF